MNRFYRDSTALLSFWQGGKWLSFVAFGNDSICDVGASGKKARPGPFVSFNNVFEFNKWSFEECRIFENFKNYEIYKVYEGSCIVL